MTKWQIAGLVVLLSMGCSDGGARRQFMSLGTGGTGGIYYPLGGALTNRLSLMDSTRRYTAEVTGGSVENLNRVAEGEMDLGMTMAITAFEAYNGGPGFPRPRRNLRLVAPLYANVTHVLASPSGGIAQLGDLEGKRVSVGPPGSGTEQVARTILNAAGLTYDDVEVRYLSFREAADALRDGAIDAAFVSAGYPAAAVLEATTSRSARLIPIDPQVARELVEQHTYFNPGEIPAGAYPGVEEPIVTVTTLNWLVGTDSLDADVVRYVLRILRDERGQLERVHAIAGQIDLSPLNGNTPLPLHEAVRLP